MENKVRIDIISLFSDDIENRPMWKIYSGIRIHVEFSDTSALEYELFKHPLIPEGISITNRFPYQLRLNK